MATAKVLCKVGTSKPKGVKSKIKDGTPVQVIQDVSGVRTVIAEGVVKIEGTTPPPICPPGQHLENGVCVPDTPPPPPPPPTGDLLYDSNRDIDWAAITAELQTKDPVPEFLKVDDVYGEFKPNGKYFRCKASGNPRAYLYPATKTIVLEHDGKYGRLYFGVCNYASRLEGEFMLDSCSNKLSLKSRNRHQYGDLFPKDEQPPNTKKQGGQGGSIGCSETDADLEIYHDGGGEVSGPQESLSPKLEANKWFKVKFSQFDKDGKIHVIIELDRNDGEGFAVINEGDLKPPSQFFNKAEFEEWSEFWVRYNADNGGKLYIKNLKMYKL